MRINLIKELIKNLNIENIKELNIKYSSGLRMKAFLIKEIIKKRIN